MSKIRYQVIVVLIMLTYSIYYIYKENHTGEMFCTLDHQFREEEFRGVIVRSYIDMANHAYPKMIIRSDDNKNREFNMVNMVDGKDVVYNFHPGDSIIKLKSSNILSKIDQWGNKYEYKTGYPCNDTI